MRKRDEECVEMNGSHIEHMVRTEVGNTLLIRTSYISETNDR